MELHRFKSDDSYTIGTLFDVTFDRKKLCVTLEDGYREIKVPGETRIPAGTYVIKLRTVGGFHNRYSLKFPDMHRGMLWLQDVPNFQYILIHIGNYPKDSRGFILVGNTYSTGYIGNSTQTYCQIYPPIAQHLIDGGKVTITIIDGDRET